MKLKLWRSLLLGLCLSNAIAPHVASQIIPDGTTNTTVNKSDNTITIDEGDRSGDNLFHSFEQFSVLNGSEAFFNNANDIVNIFSRVTGGDISNIDGLIRANGDASLFLINPAGIIFGEGAALDLGGSFFASTAESIVFTDNVEFSTIDATEPPLLTINQPLGLNFGNNPGDIAVNGSNLQVDNSETLALFGGNVTITGGQVIAPGANIELGGLTAAGQISFTQSENTFNSFSFPEVIARGNITLTNGTNVDVQAAGGGNIQVNARNLELSGGELGASSIIAGIASESRSPETQAGNVVINATGDITIDRGSVIRNGVEESAVGNSGGIDITTTNLSLTRDAKVDASNFFGRGDAGGIDITTTNLSLTEGGQVSASNFFGRGDAGEINIQASDTIEADGEGPNEFSSGILSLVENAIGNSGGINITTTNLKLTRGAEVNAGILAGSQGDAGKINIQASGTIEADGQGQDGFGSGIFNQIEESAVGNSGGIDITTTNLKLTRDAKVDANSEGQGNAGKINITTDSLFLTEGGQINASTLFDRGDAGKITIKANNTIEADGEGSDGFSSSGILSMVQESAEGNSGGIDIVTTNLKLTRGAEVNASVLDSSQGDAGEINIQASGTIEADGQGQDGFGSGIFSIVVAVGTGNPSKIDITATNLKLTRGAEVNASTFFGQRDAGEINITTDNLSLTEGAQVRTSTFDRGDAGGLNITTDNLKLAEGGQISASTFGQGDGEAIIIRALNTIEADGEGQNDRSGILSVVGESATGNAGGINITTANLKLTEQAQVSASTFGRGDAGGLNITTDNLKLAEGGQVNATTFGRGDGGAIVIKASDTIQASGQGQDGFRSGIFSTVDAVGTGNSGEIDITTTNLFLTKGGEVNASTFFGQRDASGINITTDNLSLTEGGQITASTFGQGDGGAIAIKASDTIEADGQGQDGFITGIFSLADKSAVGNASSINIDTSNLSLKNGAEISVQSLGEGNAGNLSIQANTVALSNGASLFASTAVDRGGNITMRIAKNLTLEENSTISAQALENANGGNIKIDADFVIAQPNQNNDIVASAAEGTGGDINVTTNAIFGLESRSSIPDNNTNDLDASSELGVDGTIEINELEANPTEGLGELPVEVIDVTGLVEQNLCQQGQGSEFAVTGKGGTAPSPTQARDRSVSEVDLVKPVPYSRAERAALKETPSDKGEEIVEAQGWVVNDRGMVELVASKTDLTASLPQLRNVLVCHKRSPK